MREYKSLKALRNGDVLYLADEEVFVRMIPGDIKPDDWYVGERNQGPKLGVCLKVHDGLVWSTPIHSLYPYDIGECVKVGIMEEPE